MPDYEREALALERFADWLENPLIPPWDRRSRKVQVIVNSVAENARIGAQTYRKGELP